VAEQRGQSVPCHRFDKHRLFSPYLVTPQSRVRPDPIIRPFTIGRVIHSSRGVGFTGWIGGVAVFDRALTAEELAKFHGLTK